MQKDLFRTISKAVEDHDDWFKLRRNVAGQMSASPLMKCVATVRVLAYGCLAYAIDDYVRIGEDTFLESVKSFCKAVIEIFGPEYLREPNEEDRERLLAESAAKGWPGMLGSIETWKFLPASWKG